MTHLIVGSSPFQIVLGIELLTARPDGSVVVVDAAERASGAWCTGELFGVRNLELGAHYVENDDLAYGVLERCGVKLSPMEPGPTVLVSRPVGGTVPDRVKNCALFGYGSLRHNRS